MCLARQTITGLMIGVDAEAQVRDIHDAVIVVVEVREVLPWTLRKAGTQAHGAAD